MVETSDGRRVFHDHLSTMWEGEAQEYMKDVGLFQRLIIVRDSNNQLVSRRYRDSLPGNSPENARGTDSHCFSDMMTIICADVSMTASYVDDDERKFSLATPKKCMSAMTRAWEIVPGDRIRDDILAWPSILEKIVEANGTKVESEDFRSGKRYLRPGENDHSRKKKRSRDTKCTLSGVPIHPDAEDGLRAILQLGREKYDSILLEEHRQAVMELLGAVYDSSDDDEDNSDYEDEDDSDDEDDTWDGDSAEDSCDDARMTDTSG
mmetsp:Transcript_17723/g.29647  ORF Transcript_17723/g.29647 Transcript_17723/m.29647 type:complete len:264 (-) Transcript_17723:147-938(-)